MAGDEFILGDSNAICDVKFCTQCNIEKPKEEFSRDRYQSSGLKAACKSCASIYFNKWRSSNIESARRSDRIGHYIREYGLPKEQAESIADGNRNGICTICGVETNLVIDHCHKSGVFRDRICGLCNSALGHAKDSINILENMIAYLKRHNHE